MARLLPPTAFLLCSLAVSGCAHSDQDHVASAVANELSTLPRDQRTSAVVLTGPPRKLAAVLPPVVPDAGKGQPDPFKLPQNLPGADVADLKLPPLDKLSNEEKLKVIQQVFPQLPALEDEQRGVPGPGGMPLDLPALQQMALSTNPLVQQAAADVQGARGGEIQAGLYPNPNFGFQGDSIGQAGTNGQLGGFFEQIIKTAGKLELARAAASMDVRNAELELRHKQVEVMSQVRTHYFGVLVAQENVLISRALAILAEDVYRLQLRRVAGGQDAPYEPLQLYVLAVQARGNLVQARNRHLSAWRQLAAALGQPNLPLTMLAGRADALVPGYPFDNIREHMLNTHTDLSVARNGILKSRFLLQLARVTPIPDITSHVYVQNDNTSNPSRVQAGVQVGVALPIHDRNQGNILTAEAQLAHANRDVDRVTNELSQRLAEAFERYRNNITQTTWYRDHVLPNQVRVYRSIYKRFQGEPGKVQYNDIIVAQQTLSQALVTYQQSLAAQWQAVVDLANLLQTDDMYQLTTPPSQCPAPPPVSQMLDPRSWPAPPEPAPRAALAGPTGF